MRPPAGRAAPGGGVHSGPGWDPPGQTERQGIGVIGLTSKRIRRRPHAIVGSCAVSGQGCGPSCSQGSGGICRRSAAALRGGGLYSDRNGRGAPPADPIGGRPMAPAPAARSMVRPEIQGPYHTSDPSPTARRDLRRSYIVRSISLSKRQGGPPAQAHDMGGAGPIKAAVWAACPSIAPRLGPGFDGRICSGLRRSAPRVYLYRGTILRAPRDPGYIDPRSWY